MKSVKDNQLITLPNLFTTLNLFCGFAAVVSAAAGEFTHAAWLIFIAGVFDGLDGRIARASGRNSEFGLQMDSLGDIIAAGIAPSFLIYEYHLKTLSSTPIPGLILAFVPLLFAAFRLARFNVNARSAGKKRDFTGMPAPMAASALASVVVFSEFTGWPILERLLIILIPVVGILMASHLRYDGFPRFSIRERGANRIKMLVMLIAIGMVFVFPAPTFFIFMMTYLLSGPVRFLFGLLSNSNTTTTEHFESTVFEK